MALGVHRERGAQQLPEGGRGCLGTGLSSPTHPECATELSPRILVRAGIAYLAFKAAVFLAKMALATPLLARLVAAARELVGL